MCAWHRIAEAVTLARLVFCRAVVDLTKTRSMDAIADCILSCVLLYASHDLQPRAQGNVKAQSHELRIYEMQGHTTTGKKYAAFLCTTKHHAAPRLLTPPSPVYWLMPKASLKSTTSFAVIAPDSVLFSVLSYSTPFSNSTGYHMLLACAWLSYFASSSTCDQTCWLAL